MLFYVVYHIRRAVSGGTQGGMLVLGMCRVDAVLGFQGEASVLG